MNVNFLLICSLGLVFWVTFVPQYKKVILGLMAWVQTKVNNLERSRTNLLDKKSYKSKVLQ